MTQDNGQRAVKIDPSKPMKLFDIQITVVPESVNFSDGVTTVVFKVLLDPSRVVDVDKKSGAQIFQVEHDTSIEIPVEQVRIVP